MACCLVLGVFFEKCKPGFVRFIDWPVQSHNLCSVLLLELILIYVASRKRMRSSTKKADPLLGVAFPAILIPCSFFSYSALQSILVGASIAKTKMYYGDKGSLPASYLVLASETLFRGPLIRIENDGGVMHSLLCIHLMNVWWNPKSVRIAKMKWHSILICQMLLQSQFQFPFHPLLDLDYFMVRRISWKEYWIMCDYPTLYRGLLIWAWNL